MPSPVFNGSESLDIGMTSGKKRRVVVDEGECSGCGKCEDMCPHDAIHVIDEVAVIDYDHCDALGGCIKTCPQDAISWNK